MSQEFDVRDAHPAPGNDARFFLPIFGAIVFVLVLDGIYGSHGFETWDVLVAVPATIACIKLLRRPIAQTELMSPVKMRSPVSAYLRARLAPVIGLIAIALFVAYHIFKLIHPE